MVCLCIISLNLFRQLRVSRLTTENYSAKLKHINQLFSKTNEKYRLVKQKEKINLRKQQQKMEIAVDRNKELMIKVFEYEKEMKEALAKINYLEKGKKKYRLVKQEKNSQRQGYYGELSGLQKENKNSRIQLKQIKQKINDLTRQLDALEREKKQYVLKNENLETRMLEYRDKTNSLFGKIRTLKDDINTIERKKNKFGASLNALKKENDLAAIEKDRLQKQIIELKKSLRDRDRKSKSSKEKIANLEKDCRNVTAQYELVKRKKEKIKGKGVELEKMMALLKEELGSKAEELMSSEERVAKLKKEYQVVTTQYELIKKKAENLESVMVKRASRILILQETLEEKDASILELTNKLQMQIKELALLRDSTVKIRLENVTLMENLKNKGEELNSFKEKILKMKEVNSRFKAYIGTMSNLFDSKQEIEPGPESGEESLSSKEDKKVTVEIESVEEAEVME